MARYHKRSNVESTFSAIKRKFGPYVVSKNPTAMVNEVYCKVINHNLTCLIRSKRRLASSPYSGRMRAKRDGRSAPRTGSQRLLPSRNAG